ncbi:MAG: LysR family transcriptional regulator [Nitrospiraceae bacterium]|nr:LysR family transcriptional regulator [Nitrospiraceae bacterium]
MDIHHLRVFTSVYKNKSFSRASEELMLSQPTVSDHIKTLEEELGCSLFDRLGRSIMPTIEADALFVRATEIIEKADELKLAVSSASATISGTIIFGSSTIPGSYILPQKMAAFRKKHPEVTFVMTMTDSRGIVEKVASHELMLGIAGSRIEHDQISYTPFFEDELVAVAAPSMKLSEKLSIKQLAAFPFIMREQGSGTRREMERIFEKNGVLADRLNVAALLGSTDALKQAIKAGLGIGIISKIAVADEIKRRELCEINTGTVSMRRKFYIVTHKKRTLPLLYNEFIKLILKSCA